MSAADMNSRAVAVQREIGLRGGLYRFIRMAWQVVEPTNRYVDNWHIGAIAEHLEAVTRGEIRNLVINIPPGCMKSLSTNIFWPVWDWIQDPGQRFIYASFDQRLVGQRDGTKCIELVNSPWFKERWGDRVRVDPDSAAGEFYTNAKGMRLSTSPGGRLMGYHGNKFVADDLVKPKAITDDYLKDLQDWMKSTVASRLLPGGARVLMMQRVHQNDPAGHAIREGGWEHLMLPMRYEPKRACSTSIGFKDPRTTDGELLWPAYKDEAEVAKTEKDMRSRVASAQLQQNPTPDSGIVFQRPWFKFYTVAPSRWDAACLSFDFTFKEVSKNGGDVDFVAMAGVGRKGTDYYLFDLHVERLDFPGSLSLLKRKARRWRNVSAKLIEGKANGPAVISMAKKDVGGLIEIEPQGGKEARANAVAPLYEAGNVWYPDPNGAVTIDQDQEPTHTPFVWDGKPCNVDPHLDSMAGFPFAAHDDDVDAETQALIYMRNKATKFLEAMKALQGLGVSGPYRGPGVR